MVDGKKQFIPKKFLDELPNFAPKEGTKKDDQEHADESATEKLEHELEDTFSWLAKIPGVLAVVLGALGFVFQPFGKLGIGRWLGLVSLCSIGALYFIPYFPYIFGAAAFVLFAYLIWKLYRVVKEKVELEQLSETLATSDREESEKILEDHRSSKCSRTKNTKV